MGGSFITIGFTRISAYNHLCTIGVLGSLIVIVRKYDPSGVACSKDWSSERNCKPVLQQLPVTTSPMVFGPQKKDADVLTPKIFRPRQCLTQDLAYVLRVLMTFKWRMKINVSLGSMSRTRYRRGTWTMCLGTNCGQLAKLLMRSVFGVGKAELLQAWVSLVLELRSSHMGATPLSVNLDQLVD